MHNLNEKREELNETLQASEPKPTYCFNFQYKIDRSLDPLQMKEFGIAWLLDLHGKLPTKLNGFIKNARFIQDGIVIPGGSMDLPELMECLPLLITSLPQGYMLNIGCSVLPTYTLPKKSFLKW